MDKLIIYSIIVAVIINLFLPKLIMPFATEEEIKPPNGADKLSFKGQLRPYQDNIVSKYISSV